MFVRVSYKDSSAMVKVSPKQANSITNTDISDAGKSNLY